MSRPGPTVHRGDWSTQAWIILLRESLRHETLMHGKRLSVGPEARTVVCRAPNTGILRELVCVAWIPSQLQSVPAIMRLEHVQFARGMSLAYFPWMAECDKIVLHAASVIGDIEAPDNIDRLVIRECVFGATFGIVAHDELDIEISDAVTLPDTLSIIGARKVVFRNCAFNRLFRPRITAARIIFDNCSFATGLSLSRRVSADVISLGGGTEVAYVYARSCNAGRFVIDNTVQPPVAYDRVTISARRRMVDMDFDSDVLYLVDPD